DTFLCDPRALEYLFGRSPYSYPINNQPKSLEISIRARDMDGNRGSLSGSAMVDISLEYLFNHSNQQIDYVTLRMFDQKGISTLYEQFVEERTRRIAQ